MSEPITNLDDAVRELGALPVPMGAELRTVDKVEDELTGARLSLYEEELDNARLRLALASARRGRSRLRAENERLQRVAEAEHKAFLNTHDALNLVVQDAQRLAAENGVSELVRERDELREQVQRERKRVDNARRSNRELRSQVAALLAERHTTNEALDDAVQELRARSVDRLTRMLAPSQALREPVVSVVEGESGATITFSPAGSGESS